MSFFDDDEPPTRQARPRRPAPGRAGGATAPRAQRGAAAGGPGDPQQLMVRRAVALGAGALILILLVLGVRGCLNSRTDNSFRDYDRDVKAIVDDSNAVSARLFELLAEGQGSNITDLEQNVNQVRVTADEDVKRARALDAPGGMEEAQLHLLQVLTFRADGVERIAESLPSLEGDQSEEAASLIAGQMSAFLASDVIYSQRVLPFLQEGFADRDLGEPTTGASTFLADAQWIDAAFVRKQLTGKGSGSTSGTPAPGLHGHGLLSTTIGDVALSPDVTNRVAAAANTVVNVTFANQGENDEFDVVVRVAVEGADIDVQKSVDQTAASSGEITLQVPLGTTPPVGSPLRLTVEIVKVPGEVNTDNNSATYTVIFSR